MSLKLQVSHETELHIGNCPKTDPKWEAREKIVPLTLKTYLFSCLKKEITSYRKLLAFSF